MDNTGLVITRVFNAPRSLVWKAWTDPGSLAKWWGPAGFTMKVATLDLKPGGLFHYSMRAPGGQIMWGKFTYREISPYDRIVFVSSFSDEKAGTIRNPMNSTWPLEVHNTLTLTEAGGKTTLTLKGGPCNATREEEETFAANGHRVQKGFDGTFAQLETFLAEETVADRALFARRTFDAPRDLVWKAWTDAGRIAVWWGPSGFGTTVKSMDVRTGGRWLFTMHGPDGAAYPNKIFYDEVTVPELLDYHHGEKGEPSYFHVTVRFTERDAGTYMAYQMVFPTAEGKRMAVEQYGAAEGLEQTMARLEAFLVKPDLLLTRVFDAPRSAVWNAWTDPLEMRKWWGPEHFTCPRAEIDLRVGGAYFLGMRSPDGREFWSTGIYREIVSQEKLVYSDSFSDAEGKIIPAASLGLPGHWPDAQRVTITFADLGTEKTLLTVHQESLPMEWRDMTSSGWSSSFDKLAGLLGASR